jgi:hypothetical protein
MGERYGKRWLDDFGDTPTRAWRDCLRPFSPKDIQRALDLLALNENTKQFPPTEPEFRSLLQRSVRMNSAPSVEPADQRRGFWRSVVIGECQRAMGYAQEYLGFERLVVANKHSLGSAMKNLLDEVDELESNTGQRTKGQHDLVEERAQEIAVAFRALKAAA